MPPVLAGLLTAMVFASSTITSARASRMAGPAPVVAGVMVVGLVILIPAAVILAPLPDRPDVSVLTFVIAALTGATNFGGLLLVYAALRIGTVGTVSTIASTEGAIAAVISVVAGQVLAPASWIVLAVVAVGVVLAASGNGSEVEDGLPIARAQSLRAAGLAAIAAGVFGLGLFLMGRVSDVLPPIWVLLPGRALGVAVVALPVLLTGGFRMSLATLPLIVLTGITEVVGYAFYALGSRSDIAVTAVLASMFAPIAAVAAFVLFRERLAGRQVIGIALVVAGVAILGWLAA